MTIQEAENQYEWEVANSIRLHKARLKKKTKILSIVCIVFIILGIVLIIKGLSIDIFGYERESAEAQEAKMFGGIFLFASSLGLFGGLLNYGLNIKGPKNFLPQIKNLYLNYLKCEDMSQDDKQYYVQKFQHI